MENVILVLQDKINRKRGIVGNKNQLIKMEDRGCSPELLRRLYEKDRLTINQIKERFSVGDSVITRWFQQTGIIKRESNNTYDFNKQYFDFIDDEHKAYWIGFVWCDGYVCHRVRKGRDVYEFKLSLAEQDESHLEKFNEALESNYEIKTYKAYGFGIETIEKRVYIAINYFAKNLYENYGLMANRHSINALVSKVPEHLHKHFIRGVLDAEGSLVDCMVNDKHRPNQMFRKYNLSFYTYEDLIDFIQEYFKINNLIDVKMKKVKRHEGKDGYAIGISYSGKNRVLGILDHLYEDSNIYLDRKYNIYLGMKEEKDVIYR